jgi:hypothetical protein
MAAASMAVATGRDASGLSLHPSRILLKDQPVRALCAGGFFMP